ncbi:MAG: AAA family ATPase [Hyphomicrobiales bacterium]|nr:AAA family ATPase [Hyphomicrobiales bacterium]
MRIARLDLVRYGRFTDYRLDFGPAPANGSDFHIVYGLNEAGKSTAAAAILDLLFGIEKQSAYGAPEVRTNWHAYGAMRIGARLELAGRAYEVARVKRDKNSLVDADNRPLDETFIKAELAGVERAAFRMMFSLDDESLEKGGEAILESRGDLGQLLFSASSGLAEMSRRLVGLREKADSFFRPRAKSSELAEKKRALEALKEEREKADTLASTYAELMRLRDERRAAHEAAAKTVSQGRARAEDIQRLLHALPHLAALREAESGLEPLAGLRPTPAGWDKDVARLQAEAIRLTAKRESAASAIRALEDELGAIPDDSAAMQVAARVDAWRALRSRYDAASDIPARQGERSAKRDAVADILRRLGREGEVEPQRLLPSVTTVGALTDLIAARSGVESRFEGARDALDAAKAALAHALDETPDSKPAAPSSAIEVLKARLHAARRDDSASRLRTIRADMDKHARKLSEARAALAPWRGDAEALSSVFVPSEAEIAELRRRLSQAEASRQQKLDHLALKSGESERLKAEAAVAARTSDLVPDDVAAELRSARESSWSAHRTALSAATAAAFERAMRRDDAAGAARLANARELAAARERAMKLAGVEAECARARVDFAGADQMVQALDCEILAFLPAPPPEGRDALGFLNAWRARRDDALAIVEALRDMKDAARRADHEDSKVRRSLSEALGAAGVAHQADVPLSALIEAAELAVGDDARLEASRKRVRELRTAAALAEARHKKAMEDNARWRAAWREACAGSWLGEETALGSAREALKALDELRALLKDCADLADRIDKMERDKKLFAAEVDNVARALGLAEDEDALRRSEAVERRVALARENERRRAAKRDELEAAQKELAGIARAETETAKLASAMTTFFGVGSLTEVGERLRACEARDRLEQRGREARDAIILANVANSLETARAGLEGADRTALEQELSALKTRAAADDRAHAEAFAAYAEAKRRLDAVEGDDAVTRIEERRRTILEEIKDGARRYLTLRAGVAAADEALRLYRDRHRGAMMERASRAFSEISRGAYRGLATQPNGQSETLIALSADGGSKAAEQLSKGARFQLYLALRVAGYHELAKSRPPAPFVADDIMETFDHFRAEEALKLFADMGRVGQVVYFTHHLHLAEIAKRICPEAQVHELAG